MVLGYGIICGIIYHIRHLKLYKQVQVPVQCTVSGQKYTLIEEV